MRPCAEGTLDRGRSLSIYGLYWIDAVKARLVEASVNWEQSIRKLLEMTGYKVATELVPTGGDRLSRSEDETLEISWPSSGHARVTNSERGQSQVYQLVSNSIQDGDTP